MRVPNARFLPILLVLATTTAACARNPVTGNREFVLVSEGQEISMGQEAAKEVEASIGLVDDADLQAYVRRVGGAMAARSERPQIPWRFGVVDDPTPNAFALPGGPIYITRGLMSLMDSEAELAAVLGHEIGHITARHSVSQISRSQLAQLGLGLGMVFVPQLANLGNLLGTGLQLLFLKYSRDHEREADDLGFKYSLAQSYDVREMDDVFASLARVGGESRSALPSWLATHPGPEERIERIGEKVAALPASPAAPVLNRVEFLNQVQGMVYGENPRNGFFRNGEFLHPDLRFRMQFPRDWKTQNLPQAVVAGSPQQDALIQFTLAQGSPTQAADQFFRQQGIEAGQVSRENFNGVPAVSGYFRAQTEQGIIAGLATFIQHGNHTYQVLSYTPQDRLQNYDRLFRSVVASFAPLNDPAVLNIRPNRIDIVRLPSAMSLASFNQRYPSSIPMNELAIINQVTNTNASIPAGTMLKRVSAS